LVLFSTDNGRGEPELHRIHAYDGLEADGVIIEKPSDYLIKSLTRNIRPAPPLFCGGKGHLYTPGVLHALLATPS
jgi:hypothetical protein